MAQKDDQILSIVSTLQERNDDLETIRDQFVGAEEAKYGSVDGTAGEVRRWNRNLGWRMNENGLTL